MQKEEFNVQEIAGNQESNTEKKPEQLLEELESADFMEKTLLDEAEKRIQKSDSQFQREATESGILSSLGERVKKNKLLRAALVGLSLYSANPVFASGLEGALDKTGEIKSIAQSQEKNQDMNQFGNLPESRRKDFEQIFASAPKEVKRIILDELKNGTGVDYKNISSKEDPDLLILQQQTIDLQNKGEMGPRRKGGVILPFDKEHSGKASSIEYSNDEIAKDRGMQKITIQNASENQIRNWIDYLRDSEKFKAKKSEWERKNKEGWQNVYPERTSSEHKHINEDYDNVENL